VAASRKISPRYDDHVAGQEAFIEATTSQELAMLRILYGACAAALDAFRAADNPVDEELVADLETMVERTKREIERLSTHLAKPSQ
jgi:hypothetical protein